MHFRHAPALYSYTPVLPGTLTLFQTATVSGPAALIISPDGLHVYAGLVLNKQVAMCSRNASTGALTVDGVVGTTGASGDAVRGLAISPDGANVYSVNDGNNITHSITVYSRDAITGTLTVTEALVDTVGYPREIVVSPEGTHVYVTGGGSPYYVYCYSRNGTTGALNLIGTIATGLTPFGITITPDGTHVYVANYNSKTVGIYIRNSTTGILTANGSITVTSSPYGIAISPNGTSVYTSQLSSSVISHMVRNVTTGGLTLNGTLAVGGSSHNVVVSPDGASAYVTNNTSNSISLFARDQSTGSLTSLGATVATGTTGPNGIVVSPDNNHMYVACAGNGIVGFTRA